MSNTELDTGETPATPRKDAVTVIRSTPSPAWGMHAVWYHASAEEAATTELILDLISTVARIGATVITIPGTLDRISLTDIMAKAKKRQVRILPDISQLHDAHDAVSTWLEAGAWGVELGAHCVNSHVSHIGDLTIGQLQAFVSIAHEDAVLSLGINGRSPADFAELSNQVHDAYVHIVRSRPLSFPLSASNFGPQLIQLYRLFNSAGTLPAWDLSGKSIYAAAGYISPTAITLMTLALPGIIHIDRKTTEIPSSIRHMLRLRNASSITNGNIGLDQSRTDHGIVRIFVDDIEVRINFGTTPDLLPADSRILATSTAELQDHGSFLLPAGEVAWLRA